MLQICSADQHKIFIEYVLIRVIRCIRANSWLLFWLWLNAAPGSSAAEKKSVRH